MAPPPRIKGIARESIPGAPAWVDNLLLMLNEFFSQVGAALTRRLTRKENLLASGKTGIRFTTPAAGIEPVPVAWDTVSRPEHVQVTKLEQANGTDIDDVWSCTWKVNQKGQILLRFQGLTASTEYFASILYE